MVWLHDALTLDAPRPLTGGYLAVRARAARTGVYQYAGYEVDPTNAHGLRDTGMVNVLRDEQTVFDERAVRSFIGKPITDDHPKQPVTKDNWREHARGTIMGALRDGDYLAFDLMLTDAAAIDKVNAGKRELSNGYAAELEFGTFTASDGTVCQARQSKITGGNHVALVDRGRAGPDCRIADGAFATCDANAEALASLTTQEKAAMKIRIGDAEVDATNGEAVRIAVASLDAKLTAKDGEIGTLTAKLSDAQKDFDKQLGAKDAEIEGLKAKVVDQAQIDALADAKAEIVAKAKAILGDKAPDAKGKTVAEVRRAVVAAKFGDAAVADKSDDYVEARFDALADAKPDQQGVTPILAPKITGDAATEYAEARAKHKQNLSDAWRQPAPAAS